MIGDMTVRNLSQRQKRLTSARSWAVYLADRLSLDVRAFQVHLAS
jgi:hypothetical protein